MNRNKIRHKILRLLIENYNEVNEKYGDGQGFISPEDEHRISIPVNTIIERLKMSYQDFDRVITKALKDKALKYDTTHDFEECITLAENTRLFYNEEMYLNQKSNWKEKHPFLYDIILILVTAFISVITTLSVAKFQRVKEQDEQNKIDIRQDSLINKLADSLKVIQMK